jgi:hypothetical protein
MPIVKMPDGVNVQFPDDMPREQIRDLIAKKFPDVVQSSAMAEGMANSSRMSQVFDNKAPAPTGSPDLMGSTAATLSGLVSGIPVVGPMAQNVSDAIVGAGSVLTGGDYGETVEGLQQRRQELTDANPVANVAGMLAGGVGAFGAASKAPALATSLGMTGTLPARIGNSALSGAALSAGDAAIRDGDPANVAANAGIGGLAGALIPGVGAAVKAAAGPVVRGAQSIMRGATAPETEAARAVGKALSADADNVAVPVLSQADEAAARLNDQQLLNVDRGGETTRALMRSAANQNPAARATVAKAADDRFATQARRATGFFNRVMGGNVDDLARRAEINAEARALNGQNYRAAYSSPRAQSVFSKELQDLMRSPTIQQAISAVKTTGADEAVINGMPPVQNPFRMGQDGTWRLVQRADGTTAVPSLQFWDQVQRNLRGVIGSTARSGDKEQTARLTQLRNKLLSELDNQVPEFSTARQGAFRFFSAENALDAGKKAFAAPKSVDESLAAFRALVKEDKEDFAVGMISEALDAARAANNRSNMTRMFDSEARQALMREALGKERYSAFEQFIGIEDAMDRVRGALGNSTTARQLVEMGLVGELRDTGGQGALGGIAGFAASGGNLGTAATMAILTAAGRQGVGLIKRQVDSKVMEQVARLLASGSPNDLELALTLASQDAAHAAALEAIDRGMGVVARGIGQQAAIGQ